MQQSCDKTFLHDDYVYLFICKIGVDFPAWRMLYMVLFSYISFIPIFNAFKGIEQNNQVPSSIEIPTILKFQLLLLSSSRKKNKKFWLK